MLNNDGTLGAGIKELKPGAAAPPVYDRTTAIQLKKLTAVEFFGKWLKCKIQLQRKSVDSVSSLALAILHAMKRRETKSKAAFLEAI